METGIEDRIRRVERTNRLVMAVAVLAVIVAIAAVARNRTLTRAFQVEQLDLVDANGMVRATLGTDADGTTGLFIRDPEGILRMSLAHNHEESALYILDSEGTTRIGVAQFAHGGGGFALHGENAKGATVLYHKGTGSLSMYDDAGGITTRVPAQPAAASTSRD